MQLQSHYCQEGMNAPAESYSELPCESNCVYYIRTGHCRNGMNCRFNHPTNIKQAALNKGDLPERVGQPECQYYMKSGACKFGAACKYHHPPEEGGSGKKKVNILGLPIRLGQKDCVYYMRTGTCKYGLKCKFNHPQPNGTLIPVPAYPIYSTAGCPPPASAEAYLQGVQSWTSTRYPYDSGPYLQSPAAYMPFIISLPQGWTTYQGPLTPIQGHQEQLGTGLVCRPIQSVDQRHLAPFIGGFPGVQYHANSRQTEAFPERPGHPECQYFLKTGVCKFGMTCKYHHPKEKAAQLRTRVLSPIGLPVRSGRPTCAFYNWYGICKFGPKCKFDHPFRGLTNCPSTSSLSELRLPSNQKLKVGSITHTVHQHISETSQEVTVAMASADQNTLKSAPSGNT